MREENIVTIGDYIRSQFPMCQVQDTAVANDHIFRAVGKEDDEERCRLQVSEDFLFDTPPKEVDEELERFNVADCLREARGKTVLLTTEGVEIPDE